MPDIGDAPPPQPAKRTNQTLSIAFDKPYNFTNHIVFQNPETEISAWTGSRFTSNIFFDCLQSFDNSALKFYI